MTQNFDSENRLECSVCLEQYTLTENDRLPRLLPCHHTVCERCLQTLLDGGPTTCPECRGPFPLREVRTFPQNNYLLPDIRRKVTETQTQQRMCEKHGKDLNLYCKEISCQKVICQLCREKEHKDHDVSELQEFKESIHKDLVANAVLLKDYHQLRREKLLETRDVLQQRFVACDIKLQNEREMYITTFTRGIDEYDNRQKTVKDRWEEANRSILDDVRLIDESLCQIDNIMCSFNQNTVTIEDVTNRVRGLNRIFMSPKNNIAGSKSYSYFNYETIVTPTVDVEMCGKLIQNEMNIEPKKPLATVPGLQCKGKGFNILKCEFSVNCTSTKSALSTFL